MIETHARGVAYALGLLLLTLAAGGCSSKRAAKPGDAAQDLCSKQGLMRLVPQFKNAAGEFQIPNPETDLAAFLAAHQGLSNAIDMLLARANVDADPYKASTEQRYKALTLGAHWRGAEIGIQTDGETVSFVNPAFASYGGPSFLEGLTPIEKASGVFYAIHANNAFPALIYPMPIALPCVSRLTLAAGDTAGSWPAPTYALGPPGGEAFLIVNICQDLGKAATVNGQQVLSPNAELILAFQWADTPDMAAFKTDKASHRH